MGYTHYWFSNVSFSDAQWASLCADARKIFKKAPCPIAYESDVKTAPMISYETIRFNGRDDAGYETFMLHREANDEFCKTAQKDYDPVVCAVLIAAHKHGPDVLRVTSDGWIDEWQSGLALATRALGGGYAVPPLVKPRPQKVSS